MYANIKNIIHSTRTRVKFMLDKLKKCFFPFNNICMFSFYASIDIEKIFMAVKLCIHRDLKARKYQHRFFNLLNLM